MCLLFCEKLWMENKTSSYYTCSKSPDSVCCLKLVLHFNNHKKNAFLFVNKSQVLPIVFYAKGGQTDQTLGKFISEFCATANLYLTWTNSPTDTEVAFGWCWAYSPCSADTELPGLSLVVSWWLETDMLLSQRRCFFPAILLITLRAFWLDWNFSRRALYMLPPSLCPSVCMVSLEIAIFPVKPCICQRTSCVCAYNASPIVFFSFYFSVATVFIARMWQNKYVLKGKGKRCFPHIQGLCYLQTLTSARSLHFMLSAYDLHMKLTLSFVKLWSCVKSEKK